MLKRQTIRKAGNQEELSLAGSCLPAFLRSSLSHSAACLPTRPFILALGILLAAGCSSDAPQDAKRSPRLRVLPTPRPKPRIALVMKSLANEFFATMAEGAKQHQRKHAGDYELIVNGIKDERDLSRQVALVDEMIAQGVNRRS